MKYLLAVLTCVAVVVAYLLIGAAVFGWKHGGGVILMIILFAAVGAIWGKMTQRITNDTANDINGAESTAGAHSSEEAIRQRILRSEQQAKWLAIALLMVALIAVVIARFSNTTVATRAGSITAGWQQRDFSTPSSRLVGHWRNANGGAGLYYDFIDPQLKVGIFIISNDKGNTFVKFKVLSEEPSGKILKTRAFLELNRSYESVDIEYCIPKDGQSMTQEWTFGGGSKALHVYSYVDGRVDPSSSFEPFHRR